MDLPNFRVERVSRHQDGKAGDGQANGDAALVRSARRGDLAAFDVLVERYQRRATALAYRLLNHRDEAMEVTQDAFLKAFEKLATLWKADRFGPWLLRIVSNLALNFRRSRSSRLAASLDDALAGSSELRRPTTGHRLAEEHGEEDGALPEELRGVIGAALEQLPEKQRLALVLFSVEGMPQKEVAEVLECSIELVKWNVFQARKKLRDLLQEYL